MIEKYKYLIGTKIQLLPNTICIYEITDIILDKNNDLCLKISDIAIIPIKLLNL